MKIPVLSSCPHCGTKVRLGYCCGEYFIFSDVKSDCICNHFTEMHSSIVQEIKAWNQFCYFFK